MADRSMPRLRRAARVAHLMEDDEGLGRWRLRHFTRTVEEFEAERLRTALTDKRPSFAIRRVVPPGDYISLQRRMTPTEVEMAFEEEIGFTMEKAGPELVEKFMPDSVRWIPVMSDTPAEIEEHEPALRKAKGRVLITGLGLGCLPKALLTLPSVQRIDIIEIDPEVILLTGKYLKGERRVHIWQGSAADLSTIPEDVRRRGWNYAWHDIWSHISPRNLRADEAEHGISYGRLMDLWMPHARRQDAWAMDQAVAMKAELDAEREAELEFRALMRGLPLDERIRVAYHRAIADRFKVGAHNPFGQGVVELPDEFVQRADPDGSLLAHITKVLSEPDFWAKFARDVESDEDAPDPIGNPNEHLEVK